MTLRNLPNLALTLADSVPDISSVPAEFVKNFFIMLGFAAVMGCGGLFFYRRGKKAAGNKEEPFHVAQPVEIKKHAEYAPREETQRELQAINQKLESMQKEWLGDLRAQQDKADKDIKEVLQAGHERELRLVTAMGEMGEQLRGAVSDEFKELRRKQSEDARGLHNRIDDVLRATARKRS